MPQPVAQTTEPDRAVKARVKAIRRFLGLNYLYAVTSAITYAVYAGTVVETNSLSIKAPDLTFSLRRTYIAFRIETNHFQVFLLFADFALLLTVAYVFYRTLVIALTNPFEADVRRTGWLLVFVAVGLTAIWLGFGNGKGAYEVSVRKPLALDLFTINVVIVTTGAVIGEMIAQAVANVNSLVGRRPSG